MHVFRLRKRFAELLEEEVAQTVETPEEAADELRWLCWRNPLLTDYGSEELVARGNLYSRAFLAKR